MKYLGLINLLHRLRVISTREYSLCTREYIMAQFRAPIYADDLRWDNNRDNPHDSSNV